MHVLHVVHEREQFLQTLAGLMRPTASTIGLTSIFRAGGRGDVFLRLLSAAGELAPGLDRPTLERILAANLSAEEQLDAEGSMAYGQSSRP